MGFNMSNEAIEKSYNEVKFLMKFNHSNSITIKYDNLDTETELELRNAINNVLHKRANELSSNLSGAHTEFVVHNGRL